MNNQSPQLIKLFSAFLVSILMLKCKLIVLGDQLNSNVNRNYPGPQGLYLLTMFVRINMNLVNA